MKAIQNIKYCLLILPVLMSVSLCAQIRDKNNAPFTGIWEYKYENRIFRLIIWEENEPEPQDNRYYLGGYYEISEINGKVETVLFTSKPTDFIYKNLPEAFRGKVENGIYTGKINVEKDDGSGLRGDFRIHLLTFCDTCLPRFMWEVSNMSRLDNGAASPVPTSDLILPNGVILRKMK